MTHVMPCQVTHHITHVDTLFNHMSLDLVRMGYDLQLVDYFEDSYLEDQICVSYLSI